MNPGARGRRDKLRDHIRDSSTQPLVCGVLNVTPDSFCDGGRFNSLTDAIGHALAMAGEGADLVDVGGESTRPGSVPPSEQQELDRVIPVIEAINERSDVPLSVDTSRPAVMTAAIAAGAVLVNDVRALRMPGAVEAAASGEVLVCLTHLRGQPRTMQDEVVYTDATIEVVDFLRGRIQACTAAGIERDLMVVDPGFGFGKLLEHNLALFADLELLSRLGPLMFGVSRKAMIGQLTGRPVEQRLAGSVAAASLGTYLGARILRVHDVGPTLDAVKVAHAVKRAQRHQAIPGLSTPN